MENEFIPKSLQDNIILNPSHHSKLGNYMYDLSQNNLKNNIYTVISNYNKLQLDFLSEYIFIDINEIYYHPILKIISMVHNLININTKKIKPLIIYSSNGHFIYLNNWQDEYYFIEAFLILFLFRDDKHLAKHKTAILL